MSYAGSAVRSNHSGSGGENGGSRSEGNKQETFADHTQLFAQGATAIRAFRILEGKVRLVRETGLRKIIVDEVGPGELVGFNEALMKGRYNTGCVALGTTVVEPMHAVRIGRQVASLPDAIQAQLKEQARREQKLLEAVDAPAVEQSFLGICRGIELLLPVGAPAQPESQLLRKLRDLFGMPSTVLKRVLRVLVDLNLLASEKDGPMEAMLSVNDPRLMERATGLVDRWLSTLPSILTKDGPMEPYTINELAEELELKPNDVVRRIMGSDFPTNILRFDAEGVANIRAIHGDAFFKKKITSRDLVSDAQSIEELIALEVTVLREFIPQMDLSRLCQLLTRVDDELSAHLLGALTPRMRRVAKAEVSALSPISDGVFADIEHEVMEMARAALGGRS